jgi:hypothetical protein
VYSKRRHATSVTQGGAGSQRYSRQERQGRDAIRYRASQSVSCDVDPSVQPHREARMRCHEWPKASNIQVTGHTPVHMYIVCSRAQQGSLAVATQTSNVLKLGEDSQLRWQGAVQGIRVGLQGPGTCNISTALLWVSNSHREGERPLSRATAYVPCRHLLPQAG